MRSKIVLISVVLLLAFAPVSNAVPVELANSITGFSGTQSTNGWNYRLDNNGVISDMIWDGSSEWLGAGVYSEVPFTLKINATSQSTNKIGGGIQQGPSSKRYWTTALDTVSGITVAGNYNITAPDARVQLFWYDASTATTNHVADLVNGSGAAAYSKAIASFDAGDSVIMRLGPWTNAASAEILMAWDMTVTGEYIPEPATMCLLALGGLVLRRKRR